MCGYGWGKEDANLWIFKGVGRNCGYCGLCVWGGGLQVGGGGRVRMGSVSACFIFVCVKIYDSFFLSPSHNLSSNCDLFRRAC